MAPLRAQAFDRRWLVVAVGLVAFLPLFYLRHPVHVPSLQPINRIRAASGAAGVVAGQVLPFLAAMLPYACASAAVLALLGAYLGRGGWVIEAQARLGRRSLGIYAMHDVFMWWFASHGLKNVIALMLVALGLSALAGFAGRPTFTVNVVDSLGRTSRSKGPGLSAEPSDGDMTLELRVL